MSAQQHINQIGHVYNAPNAIAINVIRFAITSYMASRNPVPSLLDVGL